MKIFVVRRDSNELCFCATRERAVQEVKKEIKRVELNGAVCKQLTEDSWEYQGTYCNHWITIDSPEVLE
jgi:hypothetical protein